MKEEKLPKKKNQGGKTMGTKTCFCFSLLMIVILMIISTSIIIKLRDDNQDKNILLDVYKAHVRNVDLNCTDPTFMEMFKFLIYDETDSHPYIKDEFTCSDFTAKLIINASLSFNIRSGHVTLTYEGEGSRHAMVAFNTTDEGLIFVEPQSDRIVDVFVGCENHDRIVKEIYISWVEDISGEGKWRKSL